MRKKRKADPFRPVSEELAEVLQNHGVTCHEGEPVVAVADRVIAASEFRSGSRDGWVFPMRNPNDQNARYVRTTAMRLKPEQRCALALMKILGLTEKASARAIGLVGQGACRYQAKKAQRTITARLTKVRIAATLPPFFALPGRLREKLLSFFSRSTAAFATTAIAFAVLGVVSVLAFATPVDAEGLGLADHEVTKADGFSALPLGLSSFETVLDLDPVQLPSNAALLLSELRESSEELPALRTSNVSEEQVEHSETDKSSPHRSGVFQTADGWWQLNWPGTEKVMRRWQGGENMYDGILENYRADGTLSVLGRYASNVRHGTEEHYASDGKTVVRVVHFAHGVNTAASEEKQHGLR